MDTVLYKQLLAIVATIEKLQKDFKDSTVSVTKLEENLKKAEEKNKESEKTLDSDIKLLNKELQIAKTNNSNMIKDNIDNLTKKLTDINDKFDKIDINNEIIKELENYTKTEALQSLLNDLKQSINDITLKHGKDGRNGRDGLNRTRW